LHACKFKEKRQADYWDYLETVLVTETVNGAEVLVCKLRCTRGEGR